VPLKKGKEEEGLRRSEVGKKNGRDKGEGRSER